MISGHGRFRVSDKKKAIGPAICIYLPIGSPGQLIDTGDETLKVLGAASFPVFSVKPKGKEIGTA